MRTLLAVCGLAALLAGCLRPALRPDTPAAVGGDRPAPESRAEATGIQDESLDPLSLPERELDLASLRRGTVETPAPSRTLTEVPPATPPPDRTVRKSRGRQTDPPATADEAPRQPFLRPARPTPSTTQPAGEPAMARVETPVRARPVVPDPPLVQSATEGAQHPGAAQKAAAEEDHRMEPIRPRATPGRMLELATPPVVQVVAAPVPPPPAPEPESAELAAAGEEEARPGGADADPALSPDARFQVQIMSTSDPEGAEDMRMQALLVFPGEHVEVVWDPPNYKVRVGGAANMEAANELKRRALRLGFQNAWVVPRRQS